MNKQWYIRMIQIVKCLSFLAFVSTLSSQDQLLSFREWSQKIVHLPIPESQDDIFENEAPTTALEKAELNRAIRQFLISLQLNSNQNKAEHWLNRKNESKFFVAKLLVPQNATISFHGDIHGDIHSLMAMLNFLQHAGYLGKADGFRIRPEHQDSFYMIFLGDYVDRGWYGAEVLYTLLRLKMVNPNNVFLIRGNHESESMNFKYGFIEELRHKYGHQDMEPAPLQSTEHAPDNEHNIQKLQELIFGVYDLLPAALYLGVENNRTTDIIQCNHGGIEFGFDPRKLLATPGKELYQWIRELDFNQAEQILARVNEKSQTPRTHNRHKNPGPKKKEQGQLSSENPNNPALSPPEERRRNIKIPTKPFDVGFLWNDFYVNSQSTIGYEPGRGVIAGKDITQEFVKTFSTNTHKIRGIFRSHQHSGDATVMMEKLLMPSKDERENKGVFKMWKKQSLLPKSPHRLWDGIVCTFLVSPYTPYGFGDILPFDFDTFALLYPHKKFSKWQLHIHRTFPGRSTLEYRFPTLDLARLKAKKNH